MASAAGSDPPRLLLVEDEATLAEVIAEALREHGYDVDVSAHGNEALDLLASPDATWSLVILDRMLPGLDGLTVCREARSAGNTTPVLMLTALDSVDDRVEGLDAGADDYLTKPFALKELYARVRALLRAGDLRTGTARPAGSPALVAGDLRLDVAELVAWRGDERIDLRPKEAAILACLMRDAGRIVSRRTIIDAAWPDSTTEPSANQLDVHMRRVREKVDRAFGRDSIETVYGAGYRLHADER